MREAKARQMVLEESGMEAREGKARISMYGREGHVKSWRRLSYRCDGSKCKDKSAETRGIEARSR